MKQEKVTSGALRSMPMKDLCQHIEEWRRELFGLRLNSKTTAVKDISQFKKMRRNIARGMTIYNQRLVSEFFDAMILSLKNTLDEKSNADNGENNG